MSSTQQPLIEDAWKNRLRDVLNEQREIVGDLAQLAEKQQQLIREGKSEPLLALLSERQRLVDRVTSRQDELSELTKNLNQRLDELPADQRTAFRSLIDGITQDLARIIERDDHDRSLLQDRRDETQGELKSLRSARKAHNAYAAPKSGATNRFADRQG